MAQKLQGVIVSNAMAKTVVVEVSRLMKHPRYGKYMHISKRYQAHAEQIIPIGSVAVIESTSPISRHKRWRVVSFEKPIVETMISLQEDIVDPREPLEGSTPKT